MELYRERVWPAPWIALVAGLAIPASLLTFAPVSMLAGAVVGVIVAAGVVGAAMATAPVISVHNGVLRAGSASIPVALIDSCASARGDEARRWRGPELDARAFMLLRPDVDPVIRIVLNDPDDPTPYWLLSTRNPEGVAAAIASAAG